MTNYEGEWELTPKDLATLFLFKGWRYATPTLGYGSPGPDQIETLYRELAMEIEDDGRTDVMATRGRFMAVCDTDTHGSIDLYLNVGYMWRDELDEDEMEMLREMGLLDEEDENG